MDGCSGTISFFKDFGTNVGILPVLIKEVAPPFTILAVDAAMNLFGYLIIYLTITGCTTRPHLWQKCLYIAFANTGVVVTCVRNFPDSRGVVLGLLKGFVGLSSGDPKSLVLLVVWLLANVSLVFLRIICCLNPPPHHHQSHEFKGAYTTSSIVVLFLLLLTFTIVVREETSNWNCDKPPVINDGLPSEFSKLIDRTPPTTTPKKGSTSCSSSLANIFTPPKRSEDYSILQAVVSIDMLIIIVTTIRGVGGTLTAIDNMGQIGKSLSYNAESVGTLVSPINIWNYSRHAAVGFV
ncbi:protein NUCLEAR FUSION DEFECTIVE 4-like [Canna indica]|uniref:Protein NUCLEAR FUSION DEFECTIVE 4-like n=1 Tax=Canna indica TaxID=4628 RepID=A0AAQ3KC35_9LILI|nr:protein NUCLEAR FUSION DEFECTIVE 4-like [Canna indica]